MAGRSASDGSDAAPVRPAPAHELNCSVGGTIAILSDAWTFLVIREALFGARRFEAFRTALKLPRGTLAARLRKLTEHGIFRQVRYSPTSSRVEYRLTRCGMELYPCFIALMQFGDKWLVGTEGKPLTLIHDPCGHECRPFVGCSRCLAPIEAARVAYRDGPGAGRAPAEPARRAHRTRPNQGFSRGRPSSVSRALDIVGDRWSFLIIRQAFYGVRRFDRLRTDLGIAPNMLAERLARLVASGVFERRKYQEQPERYEYRLTAMGRDLYGALLTMAAWGDKWLFDGEPPVVFTHVDCGRDFTPVVVCDHCHAPIEAPAMRYRMNYDPADFDVAGMSDRGESAESAAPKRNGSGGSA